MLFSTRAGFLQKTLTLFLIVFIGMGLIPSAAPPHVDAQGSTVVLTLRMPRYMQDLMDRSLIDDFEAENPGIQVVLSDEAEIYPISPNIDIVQHLDQVEEYVQSADVVMVTPQIMNEMSTRAGYFLNLAPLVNTDTTLNTDDFFAPIWQSYQWDASVWAIPVSTDLAVFVYDPAAFDAAGLGYPNANWTIDDLENAAELLAQRDSSGNVVVPGMSAFFENNLALLIRAFYGGNVVDESILPNSPDFSDPSLELVLNRWIEIEQQGIVINSTHDQYNNIPLRMGPPSSVNATFGGSGGGGGGGGTSGGSSSSSPGNNAQRTIAILPSGTAGLNVHGFAVSSGTQYPEAAYQLVRFLSNRPDVANHFQSVSPARQSVAEALATGDFVSFQMPYTPEEQVVVDTALQNGIPVANRRFTLYLESAVEQMRLNGVDAQAALQAVEVDILEDVAEADARNADGATTVLPPELPPELGPDEISINFGLSGPIVASAAATDDGWDQFLSDFTANDAQVGYVNVEEVNSLPPIQEMAENYDCFILPYNAISSEDITGLLSLDPLIDNDPLMVRSDFIPSVLRQVEIDNHLWALPLSIQPSVIRYNPDVLTSAGIPLPENEWTITEFVDALHQLKTSPDMPAPFLPLDFQGTYMLMLINAFGGVPIDYRVSPPTINFTDPATVEAIQQALDLAKDGYIEYQALSANGFSFSSDGERVIPLAHDNLAPESPFSFYAGDLSGITLYPYGTSYRGMTYTMRTAYISANAPNPEACYRLIAAIARQPDLQSGLPSRLTLVTDPTFVSTHGDDLIQLYSQFEAALADPNTIVIPSGVGGGVASNRFFMLYWLFRAADRYVLEDADLAAELAEAELLTTAFLECAAGVEENRQTLGNQRYYEELNACATSVDPTFRT